MLSNLNNRQLEAAARLEDNGDFQEMMLYFENEAAQLTVSSLSMDDNAMYRTQGAALALIDFLEHVRDSKENIKAIREREDKKRRAAINAQFENSI